jgi:hypothetical protein
MINGTGIFVVVIGVCVVTTAVFADMTPVLQSDAGEGQLQHTAYDESPAYTKSASLFNYSAVSDIGLWPVQFLPESNADIIQTSQIQHPPILTNGPGSLSLCLSALMGLGLCGSVHWVKRLSFGFVPEWYHSGGPFQIGHSHALMPGSLSPVPACCFIQSVCMVEELIPQYRQRVVMSLWRKSQFTPTILASRGPPNMS